jgi:hypothetical protein
MRDKVIHETFMSQRDTKGDKKSPLTTLFQRGEFQISPLNSPLLEGCPVGTGCVSLFLEGKSWNSPLLHTPAPLSRGELHTPAPLSRGEWVL